MITPIEYELWLMNGKVRYIQADYCHNQNGYLNFTLGGRHVESVPLNDVRSSAIVPAGYSQPRRTASRQPRMVRTREIHRSDIQWHGGGRNREEWITEREEWFD